ncbi:MAG: glycosyltransferase [Bdellovibrionales bacterium]|nr:glycosyltransferase [Bdellovibrionales bacterium]
MRSALIANECQRAGWNILWFTSRYCHITKKHRILTEVAKQAENELGIHRLPIGPSYSLVLLDGPGYQRNISVKRIYHHRTIARRFRSYIPRLPEPDLIYASYPSPELCAEATRFAKLHNIPLVVDIRDAWPDIFRDYLPKIFQPVLFPVIKHYRRILKYIVTNASSIIATNEATLQWALRYAGRKKMETDYPLYHGYQRTTLQGGAAPQRSSFTAEEPLRCIFVSTFGQSYEIPAVVQVARHFAAHCENRIHFTIVGDGETAEQHKNSAQGLSNVSFTGWLEQQELHDTLMASDLGFVLIRGGTTTFTLPNKVGEYLAHSLAIVSNIPGELEDLLNSYSAGFTISNPVNTSELIEILGRLLYSPKVVFEQKERAKKLYLEHFSAEKNYRKLVIALERLIQPAHDSLERIEH